MNIKSGLDIKNKIENTNTITKSIPEINEIEINMVQLAKNYECIRSKLNSKTAFMAVLKGNAYGHGIVPIAKRLEECGCDMFGVVRLSEALTLRQAGIKIPILILAPILPSQAEYVITHNISVMVDNEEIINALEKEAKRVRQKVNVHLKIDTGLNRYGVNAQEAVRFISKICEYYSYVKVEGIYTHLKDPEGNESFTKKQLQQFDKVLYQLENVGLKPPIAHAAASAGILMYPEAQYDMVRCGLILYGMEHKAGERWLPEGVKPLMTFRSYVLKIKELKAGESGGYGPGFIAKKDSKIAIVGAGYGDGISRGWKEVLIINEKVPVVGYFMDGIMVDITNIRREVKELEEVILIGSQGKEQILWEEICEALQCNEDEQLQRITSRVPKKYLYEDHIFYNT